MVDGALPAALRGTAYKVGPGRFGVGGEDYAHWLDGDGYVTALTLVDESTATWSGRYVQTDAYKEEEAQE